MWCVMWCAVLFWSLVARCLDHRPIGCWYNSLCSKSLVNACPFSEMWLMSACWLKCDQKGNFLPEVQKSDGHSAHDHCGVVNLLSPSDCHFPRAKKTGLIVIHLATWGSKASFPRGHFFGPSCDPEMTSTSIYMGFAYISNTTHK